MDLKSMLHWKTCCFKNHSVQKWHTRYLERIQTLIQIILLFRLLWLDSTAGKCHLSVKWLTNYILWIQQYAGRLMSNSFDCCWQCNAEAEQSFSALRRLKNISVEQHEPEATESPRCLPREEYQTLLQFTRQFAKMDSSDVYVQERKLGKEAAACRGDVHQDRLDTVNPPVILSKFVSKCEARQLMFGDFKN